MRGEGAIKFRQKQPNEMYDGHDLWLKVIKERSENPDLEVAAWGRASLARPLTLR